MAIRNAANVAFLLVDGRELTAASVTKFTETAEAMMEETQTLGDTWREQTFTGVRMAELEQEGFFFDGTLQEHDILTSGPGVSHILCYGINGTATGATFTGWAGAVQVNYAKQVELAALTKANAKYLNSGPVDEGKIVRTWKAAGATGASTGTPLDNGASSTGGVAYLQYQTTASGEANIRVLDSPDNITYTALFTFTKTASGGAVAGAERLTTTGAIQRYLAADITTASATGAIAAMTYFVGVQRGYSS